MLTLIKKFIREDITIPFFVEENPPPKEYLEQIKTEFIDTYKLVSFTSSVSYDKLTQTTTIIWKSPDDFLDFVMSDSHIANYIRNQHIYNLKNNIKTETICKGQ